jgi:hypothetical protein
MQEQANSEESLMRSLPSAAEAHHLDRRSAFYCLER